MKVASTKHVARDTEKRIALKTKFVEDSPRGIQLIDPKHLRRCLPNGTPVSNKLLFSPPREAENMSRVRRRLNRGNRRLVGVQLCELRKSLHLHDEDIFELDVAIGSNDVGRPRRNLVTIYTKRAS